MTEASRWLVPPVCTLPPLLCNFCHFINLGPRPLFHSQHRSQTVTVGVTPPQLHILFVARHFGRLRRQWAGRCPDTAQVQVLVDALRHGGVTSFQAGGPPSLRHLQETTPTIRSDERATADTMWTMWSSRGVSLTSSVAPIARVAAAAIAALLPAPTWPETTVRSSKYTK